MEEHNEYFDNNCIVEVELIKKLKFHFHQNDLISFPQL